MSEAKVRFLRSMNEEGFRDLVNRQARVDVPVKHDARGDFEDACRSALMFGAGVLFTLMLVGVWS